MPREYQLFVHTDGSIEIVDPVTREKCFADRDSHASEDIITMLDEAQMI